MLPKRNAVLFARPVVFALAFVGAHCSSSSGGGTGGDAGGGSDSGAGHDSGGQDAGPMVNECGAADFTANDKSDPAAVRAITFPMTGTPAQFSPHCMKVKAGQSISWSGDFSAHPLEAMGGDGNNPIVLVSTGMTTSVTFPAAGTFGYDCANHPSIMHGAILVVP